MIDFCISQLLATEKWILSTLLNLSRNPISFICKVGTPAPFINCWKRIQSAKNVLNTVPRRNF